MEEEGWLGIVHVGQDHVSQLRTLFHLEQISVTTNFGTVGAIGRIEYYNEGLSFYFRTLSDASAVADLITEICPAKYYYDRIYPDDDRFYYFCVEIVPICCGDLIFLPPKIAASLGPNIGPIVICTRVAKTFTLLDPFTLTHCFLKSDQYWKAPFTPSFPTTKLVEYVVLDILLQHNEEEVVVEEKKEKNLINWKSDDYDSDAADVAAAKKYRLADAVVARVKDIGNNDTTFQIKTHLGRILKPGDYALGYDLSSGGANTNGDLPAAILIAKTSYDEENRSVVVAHDKWESDYQLFLKDLQQDTKLIFSIGAALRNQNHPPLRPFVPLQDLLDG